MSFVVLKSYIVINNERYFIFVNLEVFICFVSIKIKLGVGKKYRMKKKNTMII